MKNTTREIMTTQLLTVHFEAPILEAYETMKEKNIRHLPIVDDDGTIVGIISDRDVQRAKNPQKSLIPVSNPGVEFDPSHEVKDFMSWPVRLVGEHEPVLEVAKRMLDEKISAFLVFRANQAPVGIVTTDDMLKLLISLLKKESSPIKLSLATVLNEFGSHHGLGFQQ